MKIIFILTLHLITAVNSTIVVRRHPQWPRRYHVRSPNFNTLATGCGRLLPGLSRLRRGVDITKLDLMPLQNYKNVATGLVRSVIDFSCNRRELWTNPNNDRTYNVPDQVVQVNTLPFAVFDANVNLFANTEELKRSLSLSVGQQYTEGMFAESSSYIKSQDLISNSSEKLAEVEAFFSAHEVDLLGSEDLSSSLNSEVKKYIEKQLSDDFDESPEKFFEFFRKYGTHYFSSGRFGGSLKVSIEISSSLKNVSNEYLRTEAKNAFLKDLYKSGFKGAKEAKVSYAFESSTMVKKRYFGGVTNLFDNRDILNWWNTVPGNPWLFGGKLELITSLIPDGPKKDALKLAYNIYMGKAYARELQRDLYSFVGKGFNGEKRAVNYLKKVKDVLVRDVLEYDEIRTLGADIRNFLYAPDWFTSKTRICYQFYSDGDGRQCSASEQNICADVNSMTSPYTDFTDDRNGGCIMKWRIESPLSEEWFQNDVQLCFRYFADGDVKQCGPGSPEISCAPVGKFTHPYKDDTDDRNGGCLLAWALVVPKESPGWLLNAKLCFRWEAVNGEERCLAFKNQLCVKANKYTHFYKDDSNNKGGCRLSWGIRSMKYKE